jgi:hypothetical protein
VAGNKKMNLKTENTKNREMNDDRAKYVDLFSIHDPGIHENCRGPSMGNPQQSQLQQVEQKARHVCFRHLDTAHDPAKGEAG